MIGALRGLVLEVEPLGEHAAELLVDVNGVGYRVTISGRHAAALGSGSGEITLSVHTHVREGAIQLFGFADSAERRTFEQLLTAHGVGPALAIGILGVLPPPALLRAVSSGDIDSLMRVPGVGRKTAQRLQLELAQRLDVVGATLAQEAGEEAPVTAELREALQGLGYGSEEIRHALDRLPEQGELEALLREALSLLAPGR